MRNGPNKWFWIYGSLLSLVVLFLSFVAAYRYCLTPVDATSTQKVRVKVEEGDGVADIAEKLRTQGVIRSELAFRVYAELSGTKAQLQAGGYALSKNQSVSEIIDHMSTGSRDEITVTILPGLTLDQLGDPQVSGSLAQQGFSQGEIEEAFTRTYSSPLLADLPAGQSLEGYIFPETYRMNAGDSLSSLLERTFDELYGRLTRDGKIEVFRSRGLNLHQALTLASIVQEEVKDQQDQKQVAQVFLKRLGDDVMLGSDVTFFYAAKKLGVAPSVNLDSPYNTRRYKGLPPGPISNMNYSALEAVANPAPGEYNFFVAGDGADEGKTFYAYTEAEHEANIRAHCHTLCQ